MTEQPSSAAPAAPPQPGIRIGPVGVVLKRRADAAEASEFNFAMLLEQAQSENNALRDKIAELEAENEALKAEKTGKGKA